MKIKNTISLAVALLLTSFTFFGCNKDEGSSTTTQNPFNPMIPPITGDPLIDAGIYGDILREDYLGLLRDPALYSITREFGPSVISHKKFPVKVEPVAATTVPWSSWWYPKKETFMFQDSEENQMQSPLTKFDLLRRSRFPNAGSAADYERTRHSPLSQMWEGLCDAWAIASIAKPEPKRPVKMVLSDGTRRSVVFTVADLKALMLKTYEAVESTHIKYYGQKFTGDISGWIFPDIFPEQFHRFIEVQIMQKRQPFVMDHDPSVEVWNIPVFRANYTMDLIPDKPDSVMVTMYVYSAEATLVTEKNFVGTKQAVREYNYVLHGKRDDVGNLVVTSGYWVKGPSGADSRNDHPDFTFALTDKTKLQQKSWNPELDINLVNEILAQSY